MPNSDGTGPLGEGPRTGFGRGTGVFGYRRSQPEASVGKGIGWGNRHKKKCWYNRPGAQNQLDHLQQEALHLEASLSQIKQRLVELEKQEHTE